MWPSLYIATWTFLFILAKWLKGNAYTRTRPNCIRYYFFSAKEEDTELLDKPIYTKTTVTLITRRPTFILLVVDVIVVQIRVLTFSIICRNWIITKLTDSCVCAAEIRTSENYLMTWCAHDLHRIPMVHCKSICNDYTY